MKRFGIVLLIALSVGFAGCSRTKVVPQDEAHMGTASFLQASVTVKAGQNVKFIDNAGGANHILVIGNNGTLIPDPNGPSQLNAAGGLPISPGMEIDVAFPTAGTFTITCTVHPSMLLTVKVNP